MVVDKTKGLKSLLCFCKLTQRIMNFILESFKLCSKADCKMLTWANSNQIFQERKHC